MKNELEKLKSDMANACLAYVEASKSDHEQIMRLKADLAAARSLLGEAEGVLEKMVRLHEFYSDEKPNSYCSSVCVEHARSTLAKLRQGREGK